MKFPKTVLYLIISGPLVTKKKNYTICLEDRLTFSPILPFTRHCLIHSVLNTILNLLKQTGICVSKRGCVCRCNVQSKVRVPPETPHFLHFTAGIPVLLKYIFSKSFSLLHINKNKNLTSGQWVL